jgi:hypothetical protein
MKHPIQPLAPDSQGRLRFHPNAIVQHLLDTHTSLGMNQLAMLDFTDDDRQQFAQLIGYSLGGYSELRSYVDDVAYAAACEIANGADERDARIIGLESKLAELREAIDALREPVARVFEMHPDDLKEG